MSEDSNKLCFVIMPIGSRKDGSYRRWKNVYENIIKPAVQKADPDITCIRADDETKAGGIMDDIISHLHTNFLCIADLTNRNPNVYYELGLRDSWHNRTILITQSHEDAIFDKFGDRSLFYDESDLEVIRRFEADIAKAITNIAQDPSEVRNPVQRYLLSRQKKTVKMVPTTSESNHLIQQSGRDAAGIAPINTKEFDQRVANLVEVMDFEMYSITGVEPTFREMYRADSDWIREVYFFWNDCAFDSNGTAIYAQFTKAVKDLARVVVVESVSWLDGGPANYQVESDFIRRVPRIAFVFPFCGRIASRTKFLRNIGIHFEHNRRRKPYGREEYFLRRYSTQYGNVRFEVWDIEDVERLEKQYHLTLQ